MILSLADINLCAEDELLGLGFVLVVIVIGVSVISSSAKLKRDGFLGLVGGLDWGLGGVVVVLGESSGLVSVSSEAERRRKLRTLLLLLMVVCGCGGGGGDWCPRVLTGRV